MIPSVEPVALDIQETNNVRIKVRKNFVVLWCGLACLLLAFSSCKSVKSQVQAQNDESRRRFEYYYLEATKKKLAGLHDEAFALYRHCLELNPEAGEVMYELGLYYMGLRNEEEGERYLKHAVAVEPDNIYYKEALASYYLRKRDTKHAVTVLEDMVRCNPMRTDVLGQLVSLYMDDGDELRAIKALDRIETIEGRNASISLEKFRLYRELGKEDKAFAELDSLAAENPNDLSYKVLIGDQYLLVQQPEKAYAIYEEVRKAEPENQALQLSLLDYYKQTANDSAYVALFDTLLCSRQTEDRVRATLMRNYIVDKENAGADSTEVLAKFDQVFNAVPQTTAMLAMYASYLQLKKMSRAKIADALERILSIEPDNQPALFQLMQYAFDEKNYNKAVEVCKKGLENYPDQLSFYFYLGFSYYQIDRVDEALQTFQVGVGQVRDDTDPSLVSDMYSIMGDLLYKKGQKSEAYAAYDSCLVYKPDNIMCLNNYAYFLSLDRQQLDKAEEMSYRTIKAEPENKTYLDTYAWILFVKGKYSEAKIYIDKVVEGGKTDDEEVTAGVLEHAGDIYAKCGDTAEALRYWKLAQQKGGDVTPLLRRKIQQKQYIEEK